MGMNRTRNQDLKDKVAFDKLERDRLAREGMPLAEAAEIVLRALGYLERGQPINWVEIDKSRYLAAKERLARELVGVPVSTQTDD